MKKYLTRTAFQRVKFNNLVAQADRMQHSTITTSQRGFSLYPTGRLSIQKSGVETTGAILRPAGTRPRGPFARWQTSLRCSLGRNHLQPL